MDKKSASALKLTVDNEVLGTLDQIAVKVRQNIREGKLPKRGPGRSVGAATIAAKILEHVVREHPELLDEFFQDEGGITPVETLERFGDLLPKDKSRRQAKK